MIWPNWPNVTVMTNQTRAAESPYLHPGEAAQQVGLSIRTLARMADAGRLSVVRIDGGHRRYLRVEIARIREGKS